jgi:hypothetical protein
MVRYRRSILAGVTDQVPVIGDVRDLCGDNTFQWEFSCKRCRTGYRSPEQHNLAGQGRGLLRMAGEWFGGDVARASWTADSYGRGYSGPSDGAKGRHYEKAVEAVLPNFRHCPRCGQWLCAHACWDEATGHCHECGPAAKAAAEPARITRLCPSCKNASAGKFCQHCGHAMPISTNCGRCGTQASPGAAFCGECGNSLR